MSKAKWFVLARQYRWDNCRFSQSDCTAEIPRRHKNLVVIHSPDPPFLLGVLKGGGGWVETKYDIELEGPVLGHVVLSHCSDCTIT